MAATTHSFKLKSTPAELDRLCRNIEAFAKGHGLSKKDCFQINLILDELFINIITYGLNGREDQWIRVDMTLEADAVRLRVEDGGLPFDPLLAPRREPGPDAEKCPIGGLGLHFVRELSDELVYQRCGNQNVLTLRKPLSEARSAGPVTGGC